MGGPGQVSSSDDWRFDTTDDELYDLSLSVGTRRHGPWPTVSRMEMTVGNPSYSRVSYGSPDYGGSDKVKMQAVRMARAGI